MFRLRPVALLLLASAALAAQSPAPSRTLTTNFDGWFQYLGDHPIRKGSRWGAHLEGQWRRHDVVVNWQQFLLRPAVNFRVTPNLMLTAGYAFVDTHRYGEFPVSAPFQEHRFWQQALLSHSMGRVDFNHRYRLEQRNIAEVRGLPSGERDFQRWRYENRFRYMFRAAAPFRGRKIEPGSWYGALYDEIFVNFGSNVAANVFDQNRLHAAVGYALSKYNRVEAGYLNQLIQQRNGVVFEVNHTLQIAFYSTLPFSRR